MVVSGARAGRNARLLDGPGRGHCEGGGGGGVTGTTGGSAIKMRRELDLEDAGGDVAALCVSFFLSIP